MESSVPTVTSVRIKSVLNGGLSTFFETTDEFVSTEVLEDNILYQVKNRRGGDSNKVVFYGDHIWSPMYGNYFDELVEFSSENTRDLDTLDDGVRTAMLNKLKGDQDFKLMLAHVIGVDSAGHTYNSQNENIERKLRDTEDLIREVIELMDSKTTLIVYGDHGMTDDGNHGGGS
jgi:GPI ethanolamine phosphate transferase 3 subunit O